MTQQTSIERVFQMSDSTWARHANPLSFYTRIPILPLAALVIYARPYLGWWYLAILGLLVVWTYLNPRVFPPPARLGAYPSRAVLGERLWLARRRKPIPRHHEIAARLLSIVALLGLPFLVFGLIVRDPFATLLGVVLVMGGKLWFIDRMVWLHDEAEYTPVYRRRSLVTNDS